MHEPAGKQEPLRESVEDLVREFRAKTFTNRGRSKVKVVVPESPGLECELVQTCKCVRGEKTFLYVFTLGIFSEPEGVIGM
jgi:hypothetical protein